MSEQNNKVYVESYGSVFEVIDPVVTAEGVRSKRWRLAGAEEWHDFDGLFRGARVFADLSWYLGEEPVDLCGGDDCCGDPANCTQDEATSTPEPEEATCNWPVSACSDCPQDAQPDYSESTGAVLEGGLAVAATVLAELAQDPDVYVNARIDAAERLAALYLRTLGL